MPKPIEISATYLSEFWRSEEGTFMFGTAWLNGSENREITICGECDRDELKLEQQYTWTGEFRKDKRGEKFYFSGFALKQPHTRQAIIYYLAAAGDGANANFGRARATKCWELFGEDAVKMLREQPADVADSLSQHGSRFYMSADQARRVAEVLQYDVALESVTIEVNGLLAGRGFRRTLAKQVIRDFGAAASRKIRRNPFTLLGYAGCGFKLCDAMWLDLQLPAASLKRQAYCAWHAVDGEREGSTWIVRSVAEQAIRSSIAGAELKIDKAIRLAVRSGMLREIHTKGATGPIVDVNDQTGNVTWLGTRQNAEREELLARLVADAIEEPHCWPNVSLVKNIDEDQPDILRLALQGSIAILCGRPGSGKTFVAANVIKALIEVFGHGSVAVGAPTNLAAQRLNQGLAEYQVPIKARTAHSLLGRPIVRGQEWRHNQLNPLPFKVIVLDEQSMKDLRLMLGVFLARAKGTMILLLGDTDQLPPVDRGKPLADFIAAGLPCGKLTKIRRNSGGIVEACAAIADGKPWGPGDNLKIIEVDDEDGQAAAVSATLVECRAAGFDPVWDSRVIVARNETRRTLNKLLQGELNPNPTIDGVAFRLNDKVICRESKDHKVIQADASDEDCEFSESGEQVRIANGEIGRVLEIGDKWMNVAVDAPRRVVKVPLGPLGKPKDDDDGRGDEKEDKTGTGCCWDLAYAVTFHASQGSQFPWAILVASSRDKWMLYRELPYTGISRAVNQCVMIGKKSVWNEACRRAALPKRKTFLRERILLEQARRELVALQGAAS